MSSSNELSRLPKLRASGEDLDTVLYKGEICSHATSKKLLRYFEGHAKAPVQLQSKLNSKDQSAPPISPSAAALTAYDNELDVCIKKNEFIKTILFQTLPKMLKLKILNIDSAHKAWEVIKAKYNEQGELAQVDIIRQMNALRCAEGEYPHQIISQLE